MFFTSVDDFLSKKSSSDIEGKASFDFDSDNKRDSKNTHKIFRLNKNHISSTTEDSDKSYEDDNFILDIYSFFNTFGGSFSLLFIRIVKMMGFRFSSRVTNQFLGSLSTRLPPKILLYKSCFDRSDLEGLGERVKHMNVKKNFFIFFLFYFYFLFFIFIFISLFF